MTTLRANAIARSVARYPEPTLWTEALADGAAEAAVYNARKAAFAAVSAVDARVAALTAADVVTSGTLDLVARNAAEAAVFAARYAADAANRRRPRRGRLQRGPRPRRTRRRHQCRPGRCEATPWPRDDFSSACRCGALA